MLSPAFLIHGQPEPPSDLITLRAGPLTLLYDARTGFVRRIKLGRHEVLRGIYAAVRDRNWGTTPGVVREIKRVVEPQSFQIEFESDHRQADIHFAWRGTILGKADGTLRYQFDGEAKTTFRRNRIGFCVLHPIGECAGAAARQTRIDGSVFECRFPDLIEPQIFGRSSFRDLRGMAHQVAVGLWAELEFEGEVFEMEDQRNWTDASFKTYCTPLSRPFPVEVPQGSRIRQTVTLRLAGDATQASAHRIETVPDPAEIFSLTLSDAPASLWPKVGLGVATHGQLLSEQEIGALRRLRPAHLRLDVRLASENWPEKLQQAAAEARQLGAGLELAVHLPRQGEVDVHSTRRAFEPHRSTLVRVLALREGEAATSPETLQRVRRLLGDSQLPIGAGSDCNFCELNRERALGRLALEEADFLFWSINPQVHAFDQLSIMETLEAQAATVASARAFADGRPLIVSPVTLKQRFNPVATGPPLPRSPEELPAEVDPRQVSRFAAAWTLGTLAVLAAAGVESVTFFETTGWRGVMETEGGSLLPARFPATPGMVFPVFDALRVGAGRSGQPLAVHFQPNELVGLGFFSGRNLTEVVVANLSGQPRKISWAGRTLTLSAFEVTTIGQPP